MDVEHPLNTREDTVSDATAGSKRTAPEAGLSDVFKTPAVVKIRKGEAGKRSGANKRAYAKKIVHHCILCDSGDPHSNMRQHVKGRHKDVEVSQWKDHATVCEGKDCVICETKEHIRPIGGKLEIPGQHDFDFGDGY